MSEEAAFQKEIRASLERDSVPAVNLQAIYSRNPNSKAPRPVWPVGRIAIAAAAALVISLTFTPQAQAVVQSVEARFDAALRAMGIPAGPPVPRSLITTLKADTHAADVAQAAKQVSFTLRAPQGLPADVRSEKIYVSPVGEWSAKDKRWHVGENVVNFRYTRADGRGFQLQASRYDPSAVIYAYMWETVENSKGEPVIANGRLKLIRHDSLHWRNGTQVMNAIAGEGLSRTEAQTIERAMDGEDLPGIKTKGPHGGRGHRLMVVKP